MCYQRKSSIGVVAKDKTKGQKVDFLRGNKVHSENPKEE